MYCLVAQLVEHLKLNQDVSRFVSQTVRASLLIFF